MLGAAPGTRLSHSVHDRRCSTAHLGSLNPQNTEKLLSTLESLQISGQNAVQRNPSCRTDSGWWGRDLGWAVPQFPAQSPWPSPGMHSECLDGDHKAKPAGNGPSEGFISNEKSVNRTLVFLLENYSAKQKSIHLLQETSKECKQLNVFCQLQIHFVRKNSNYSWFSFL